MLALGAIALQLFGMFYLLLILGSVTLARNSAIRQRNLYARLLADAERGGMLYEHYRTCTLCQSPGTVCARRNAILGIIGKSEKAAAPQVEGSGETVAEWERAIGREVFDRKPFDQPFKPGKTH